MGTPLTEEGLERILRNNARATGSAFGGSDVGSKFSLQPAVDLFQEGASGMTAALSKVALGNMNLAAAFDITRNVLYKLGEPGKLFANTILTLVETGNQLNDNLKKTAQSGFYFGNDLAKFSESINFSRLGLEGFTQVLANNSRQLIVLRDRELDAGRNFAGLLNNMASSGAGAELLKTTGSAEILSDSLITVVSGMKYVDVSARGLGSLQERATALGTEMDNLSRLTGANSKQLNQQLQERMREAQNSAYMRTLDEAGRKRYEESMARANAMGGPIMQKLFEQLQQFGNATTEDTRGLLASLGEAAPAVTEMAFAAKSGKDTQEAYANALTAMSKRMNDPNYLNMVMLNAAAPIKNAALAAASDLEKNNLLMPAMLKAEAKYKEYLQKEPGGGKTLKEFMVEEMSSAVAERQRSLADPAAQLSFTYNSANELVQRASAGTATMFTILNEQMGKNSLIMSKVNEAFNEVTPAKITETYQKFLDMLQGSKNAMTEDQAKAAAKANLPLAPFLSGVGAVVDYNRPNISSTQINADPFVNLTQTMNEVKTKISSTTPAPTSTGGIQTVSREDQNSLLNDMNKHLGQISNYMGQLVTATDKQISQIKNMVSRISGNRGAP